MDRLARSGSIGLALLLGLLGPACSDVVVGHFSEASDAGTSTDATTSSGAEASSGAAASTAPDSTTAESSGDGLFMGCYSDDFDADALDTALWNPWTEQDSQVEVITGLLKFTPPSIGLFDAGLVGHFDYDFEFDDGWLRMEMDAAPSPDRPVALFLMVQQDLDSLWINVGSGQVTIQGSVDETSVFVEEFPMDPYPRWLGIRGEGSRVHFEVSDDGQTWTTLATHDKPRTYERASAIIMAQTYGDDPEQQLVTVDYFEACLP